jgi:hypothetical protein
MKAVEIYKTESHYKVVTMYLLESGSYIGSEPVFIVPIKSKVEAIWSKISKSLAASRQLSESEEDRYWLGNKLLKVMQESSFNALYKSSRACGVFVGADTTRIDSYKFVGKNEGLVVDMERSRALSNSLTEMEIADQILEVLKG